MRATICTVAMVIMASPALAGELPTGSKTPEGIACDALTAYIKADSQAWLATLVKPIYGAEGNKQFAEFKKEMAAAADKMKDDKTYKPPRITKCFKARTFSKNGPGSAAYAFFNFHENKFVDLVIETAPGESQGLRYHVLRDEGGKWYFEPRPDLCPLLSTGLNEEPESTEVLFEVK
jgi:hypothetical protein